jgi:hypothetical protein
MNSQMLDKLFNFVLICSAIAISVAVGIGVYILVGTILNIEAILVDLVNQGGI